MIVTSSIDKKCKIWDLRNMFKSLKTFEHEGEVMEACFNLIGSKMASRTNNGKAYLYDVKTLTEEHVLEGHESEVSKIVFDS